MTELQQLSTEEILQASHQFSGVFPPEGQVHTPANLIWNPVPDRNIVKVDDYDIKQSKVPLLIGTVENEARYFIKPNNVSYSFELLNNMAQSLTGYQNSLVLDILKNDNLTIYEALDKLFTTTIWFEPELATR
ncbi:carboxylesterase family protein [Staphylococcus saprophyticus]|uniref:carboxylesterase family protein n=1 Tax=Staphylococcus saprophyticus TaxID=29385 RepID=UPI0008536896|nr:carboxylesterase family protein [Staphylococcus saprophyticus]MDW4347241.1 carboxylesterase family protein [Staphylococcus saprophyticus]MDW4453155.1 carboxylesterase family protein [Staphylococcus saprophyticus]MDW4524299.1 carboxylesterase family protein [Staphylococcus saprophyticus]OEK43961.1 hypothetical protein ASS91_07645 [Staphylococcus saprophyticus]